MKLMEGLPNDLHRCQEHLAAVREVFYEEMAKRVTPVLNQHIATMKHDTLEDKRTVATFVNAAVKSFGLTVVTPDLSHQPAWLVASQNYSGDLKGRYRLVYEQPDNPRRERFMAVPGNPIIVQLGGAHTSQSISTGLESRNSKPGRGP